MSEPAMTLRLGEDLRQKLRTEAYERDISMSDIIREALAEHFAKEEN